jgi:hypothetical protein
MDEVNKYDIIKKLIETNGNKKRTAKKLQCTIRHVNRMIRGYETSGKEFFLHGNHSKIPSNKLPEETRKIIVDLYLNKYYDGNLKHFTELLGDIEGIHVSLGTVHSVLMAQQILSPKARKSTKKRIRKELEAAKKNTSSKKEIKVLSEKIVALEDAHPRRPRSDFFGEMLQMDASIHHWFGANKSQLHIAIDDATGIITGAYFDRNETLNGYYNVFYQTLKIYGIPYMFYTDRRTIFEYIRKKSHLVETDSFTQFSYACHQLGVELITTSVAQAKGRVERLFETLQSRLPLELRLAGAATIEQANEFLNSYIKKFNAQFALPLDNIKSVFEEQPSAEKINLTLSVIANRKIDNGHCIRFDKAYYKPINSHGLPVYYYKGTDATVIKAFDGSLYTCIDDQIYSLDVIPMHQQSSRNFNFEKTDPAKVRKRNIPASFHPWRKTVFDKFLKTQIKHYDYSFEEAANTQEMLY